MRRVMTIAQGAAMALRIVTGRGEPMFGAHTRLAIKVADVARELGFASVSIRSSHFRNSNSRHVSARDQRGQIWDIRISNHLRPDRAAVPHLDLVSVDGAAGLEDAREFLRLVATGTVAWFDSAATATSVSRPDRKRIDRCK